MSLQSGATFTVTSTLNAVDDGRSGNPCSSLSSVAQIAEAANASFSLHNIEDISFDIDAVFADAVFANPLVNTSIPLRKRSSTCLDTSPSQQQPFLSSYGSAFLSGIFADIAEANVDTEGPDNFSPLTQLAKENGDCFESYAPSKKKSRVTTTINGGHTKSYKSLATLAAGTDGATTMSPPPVVSPRFNKSTIDIFNGHVSKLQSLAFPSLPHLPATISSSSCSTTNLGHAATQRYDTSNEPLHEENAEQKSSSGYGWFVSTDDDDFMKDEVPKLSATLNVQPQSNPELAFKAITAPNAVNHDSDVQQALAADTIDDVLGDFF